MFASSNENLVERKSREKKRIDRETVEKKINTNNSNYWL